jgi:hypothetical protein
MLITRSDIAAWRQISQSVHNDVLNMHIRDAEFLDLQDLLGATLYNAVVKTPADHTDLINGGTYEYNGVTYTNVGIKVPLVYFAYARYLRFGSQTDTPFGFVEKNAPESTPVDQNGKDIMYKYNQQIAYKYWQNVRAYLERTNYPLYETECIVRGGNFRISKIS